MKAKIDKLILKHKLERNNFKNNKELEENIILTNKKTAIDNLNHKYRNKKQNLENQQKNEKNLVINNNQQRASKRKQLKI